MSQKWPPHFINPWTLWKQQWQRSDSELDQRRVVSHRTEKECLEQQWSKLAEESKSQKDASAFIAKDMPSGWNFRSVFIQEGRTIFEFQKSPLSDQAASENIGVISYFCAPTSSFFGLWPFHRPTRDVASISLERLGEKALSARAKQMLGD